MYFGTGHRQFFSYVWEIFLQTRKPSLLTVATMTLLKDLANA